MAAESKTMLTKANCYIKVAEMCLKTVSIDDAFLDVAAFNVQQGVEFLLKHILIQLNIKYSKTHDIATLVNLLSKYAPIYTIELINNADIITSWETESRYELSYLTTIKEIQEGIQIYKLFLNEYNYSISYCNSNEFQYCYNQLSISFSYDYDIFREMEKVVSNNIQRPFTDNVYKTMLNYV